MSVVQNYVLHIMLILACLWEIRTNRGHHTTVVVTAGWLSGIRKSCPLRFREYGDVTHLIQGYDDCFLLKDSSYPAKLFPQDRCNANWKSLFYVFDCENEVKEQVHFTTASTKYFKTHTKGDMRKLQYSAGNESIWELNLDSISDAECNGLLSISSVMKLTKSWNTRPRCGFELSVIFIYNITEEEEKIINSTIECELQENIDIKRFFIIQSSKKKIPLNYVYYTQFFKDLNMDDILPHICDLVDEDFIFTYSGGKYFDSTFYIARQLQDLDNWGAECYCWSHHSSDVVELETYDEVVHFFEMIMHLYFANSSNHEVNIHLGIQTIPKGDTDTHRLKWNTARPYTFFIPSKFEDWEGCFSLKLTGLKNARSLADEFYNNGKYLEKIDCDTKLPNTLAVCRDTTVKKTQIWSSNQSQRSSDDMWVVDGDSFTHFLSNNITLLSNLTYGQCRGKNHTFNNLLESYLCGDGLTHDVRNETNADMKISISSLLIGLDNFYTFKTVDISKCDNYNECQAKVTNDTVDINSNTNVTIYCLDQREVLQVKGQCSAHVVNLNLDLEYFQCRTNEDQHFYKCIKDPKGQCSDNSNLLNCENFTCPEPFFKCIDTYCVFPYAIGDLSNDCTLGEEWILHNNHPDSVVANISFVVRDLCIDSITFNSFYPVMNESRFICKNVCPQNYICVSSITENRERNRTDAVLNVKYYYIIDLPLSKQLNAYNFDYDVELKNIVPLIYFVAFYGSKCNISNFDEEFQHWDFKELKILDLSNNFLSYSNNFKSIESFRKLKYLNLSHNENLIINQKFTFPKLLEIIDLSYTNISALRPNAFYSLTHLSHLNLSFTLINKFKSLGIPNNFKLDTLFIQGFSTQYLEKDFFRGLTIQFELRASDYVMCCPQILNSNMDVDKCFAPLDIISSCKHLVGDTFKRIIIWSVGILTLVGNVSVLIYRIGWNREIFKQAYGLFITGLAVSDSFMGVYLIIIAIVDVYFNDVYVLEDFSWRNSFMCQVLGILSTLSSESSTFFICLITLDRYFKITYLFGEHRFSKTTKLVSFTLVWLVSFVLALVPAVVSDWEFYSSNGLCLALPLSSTQYKGWIFSFIVYVGLKFVLCLLIVVGQLMIFINLIKTNRSNALVNQNRQRSLQERTVALKLAFVALTDFCCWFPVGILGILSVYGHLFNREVYAWIAVFVLPINSALNPIIYTLPALYSLFNIFILNILN